jgi:hypothetical protein
MSTGLDVQQSGELQQTPTAKLVHNSIGAFGGPWGHEACSGSRNTAAVQCWCFETRPDSWTDLGMADM